MSDRSRSSYSPEEKAAALAALLEGQGVSQVAATYRIPAGTVRSWKSRMKHSDDPSGFDDDTRAEIGDMILAYLRAALYSLTQQAELMADPAYLLDQDIKDIAVAHGIMADKTIRILSALGAGGGGSSVDEIQDAVVVMDGDGA